MKKLDVKKKPIDDMPQTPVEFVAKFKCWWDLNAFATKNQQHKNALVQESAAAAQLLFEKESFQAETIIANQVSNKTP